MREAARTLSFLLELRPRPSPNSSSPSLSLSLSRDFGITRRRLTIALPGDVASRRAYFVNVVIRRDARVRCRVVRRVSGAAIVTDANSSRARCELEMTNTGDVRQAARARARATVIRAELVTVQSANATFTGVCLLRALVRYRSRNGTAARKSLARTNTADSTHRSST